MKNPKISIIVPVYNAEKYLAQCLDSIINQSYANLEIICVNDGSTDKSLDILDKYELTDSRIIILNQQNLGVSAARNNGIELVTGDYLMFIDSDDWINYKTCEIVLNRMKSDNADVAMFTYLRERKNKSSIKKIFNETKLFTEESVSLLHRRMVGLYGDELHNPENADALVPVAMKIYKTDIIKKADIKFVDLSHIGTSEDALFNLEYFHKIKRAIYINEPFYHYRRDNNLSVTTKYQHDLFEKWSRLFDYFERYIYKHNLDDEYLEALNNRIALSIIGLGLNELKSGRKVKEKINEIEKIIIKPRYKEACKNLELKYLPIHWKIFFLFAKIKNANGIYLLLVIINKMR